MCASLVSRSVFLAVFVCSIGSSDDSVKARKFDLPMPGPDLKISGSGSGVIVARRLVLTNRHVAVDDEGRPQKGFRVGVAPDYLSGIAGRVAWICEDYDLAIIETSGDLVGARLQVLATLPPLGTRVTAYGFPLGDEFGVGLTATGGQITRHPVLIATPDTDPDIQRSVWHDAATAGGSSGGPLFSEKGVLLGLHHGSIRAAKGHALAVPSPIVAAFLRACEAEKEVTFLADLNVQSLEPRYEASKLTTYITVLGDSAKANRDLPGESVLSRLIAVAEKRIGDAAQGLSTSALNEVESGDLKVAFTPVEMASVRPGDIARVKGDMTIIQVVDDALLAKIDGVLCKVLLPTGSGAELRAKLGNEIVRGVPFDRVVAILPPVDYTTVGGTTGSYFPLLQIRVPSQILTKLVADERNRREEIATAAKKQRVMEAKEKLRHTFSDKSGRFSTDAVFVGADWRKQTIELMRMADSKVITVQIANLSDADRKWITSNAKLVRDFGTQISAESINK